MKQCESSPISCRMLIITICACNVSITKQNEVFLQVGLQGCLGPWTVTPSVYSMLLINVASTVGLGALYPAKPYHEDVDFAHLCEEKQLVVVKCNWLFFHKVSLFKTPVLPCVQV